VYSDIEYESPGSNANYLDVYLPDGGVPPGTPTVMFIHGGGWRGGDKAGHQIFHNATADAGYPVVTCNYMLSTPETPSYPQAVHDVKAVVRWIRLPTGGGSFGLSPAIVCVGSSAGGHLCQMVGTTAGVSIFEPLTPPPGGYRVNALIPFFGPSDLVWQLENYGDNGAIEQFLGVPYNPSTRYLYREASPITYVTPTDPVSAFYHGTNDTTVPYQHSVMLNDALHAAGIFSMLFLYEGVGHGFGGFGGQIGASQLVVNIIPVLQAGPSPADFTLDGHVDADDFEHFQSCASGPNIPQNDPDCQDADLDNDSDIDQEDFGLFQRCYSGPDELADADCVG
jgi:acetyl esterase/lipase